MPRKKYRDFAHTGPGTLAGQFMRRFWHPVLRGQDLPVGRARPLRILGEGFTAYRGVSGTPRVVAYRCPHRGAQLSAGWVEGESIRCMYHGWKYDESGQCVEQPAEARPFCQKVQVRTYPAREYLGLIFAYLGDGEPPAFPSYPEFEGPGVREVRVGAWACNYYQTLENNLDQSHISFVHRRSSFSANGLVEAIPSLVWEEREYGIVTYGKRPNDEVRVTHFQMPATHQIKRTVEPEGIWADFMLIVVPIDDEHHLRFTIHYLPMDEEAAREFQAHRRERLESVTPAPLLGEKVLAGEIWLDDVDVPTDWIILEDYVTQVGQGRIADREHERLGPADQGVILFRKIWERELQALAEGRPLKEWRRPASLVTTSGL